MQHDLTSESRSCIQALQFEITQSLSLWILADGPVARYGQSHVAWYSELQQKRKNWPSWSSLCDASCLNNSEYMYCYGDNRVSRSSVLNPNIPHAFAATILHTGRLPIPRKAFAWERAVVLRRIFMRLTTEGHGIRQEIIDFAKEPFTSGIPAFWSISNAQPKMRHEVGLFGQLW